MFPHAIRACAGSTIVLMFHFVSELCAKCCELVCYEPLKKLPVENKTIM